MTIELCTESIAAVFLLHMTTLALTGGLTIQRYDNPKSIIAWYILHEIAYAALLLGLFDFTKTMCETI